VSDRSSGSGLKSIRKLTRHTVTGSQHLNPAASGVLFIKLGKNEMFANQVMLHVQEHYQLSVLKG
jgi:hypothetical protein